MDGQQLRFQSLKVVFSQELNGNLVRLPNKICQLLDQSNIPVQEFGIKIDPDIYVGWDGQHSKIFQGSDNILEINHILAVECGLTLGQLIDISIKHYDNTLCVTEVHVEPETVEDWEIIDANAMFFQDQILYQTRIVAKGSKLICFMRNMVCKFMITDINPSGLTSGRLTNDTLIIVAPKKKEIAVSEQELAINNGTYTVKRTVLSDCLSGISIALMESGYSHAVVNIIPNPLQNTTERSESPSPASRICCEVLSDPLISPNDVKISLLLRNALNCSAVNGHKLRITFVKLPDISCHVSIHPVSNKESTVETFVPIIKRLKVLTNNLLVNDPEPFFIELKDKKGLAIPFSRVPSRNMFELMKPVEYPISSVPENPLPLKIAGVRKLYDEILATMSYPLMMSGSVLIQGAAGMGKTLVLKNVEYDLNQRGLYVKYLDCDSIQDSSNLAKMKQYIAELFHIAYWHAPSVVLLDNADALFPSSKSSEEQPSSNHYSQNSTKLAQILMNEVEQIIRKDTSCLKLMFATRSTETINKIFSQKQFIGDIWALKPPTRYQRNDIIEQFLSQKHINIAPNLNIADISLETEGYSPADLSIIVDKFFYHLVGEGDSMILTKEIVESSLSGFVPASLRGVKLQKSTGVKWSDIGGLINAKRLLLETLEWPTKYAPIFAKSPLRLRSGILLYGYPGCGKTMLASAVAQQCGLNFISVKGPEILNKYIGASEQSVRDLFERAQAAKPCILFFDEFDSIAPKRGHDSTGVTDRVVNQMLTQMDGAEGLDGVYVLAATSRPDLIDSALLRPGRLDKSVICDMPNLVERAEILKAVTAKMNVDKDCDLMEIATKTKGFSGADLQGMSYNAYLKAVHRSLEMTHHSDNISDTRDNELDYVALGEKAVTNEMIEHLSELLKRTNLLSQKENDHSANAVVISTADLIDAYKESRPSISSQEFLKLQSIYRKFIGDRDGKMPSGEASQEIGGRTTLA